jgi:hypothetical protein
MSAIYHRFGFLQNNVDEIGIGVRGDYYTYVIGNSLLNTLCAGSSYAGGGSYVYGVCADPDFRISSAELYIAKEAIAETNPAIVLWPPNNATDVPPVFYEETPDPLPNHGVTGYPVSIEFNDSHIAGAISVQNFVVFDASNNELAYAHRVLSRNDDYNGLFSPYQFAVFPLQRLAWGKTYRAEIDFTIDGSPERLSWYFTTRGLPNPYYQIDSQASPILDVVSGQTYSVYFVPRNANDRFNGYSYSFSGGMTVDPSLLDGNTINVRMTGSIGQQATFNFSNGQQLVLRIAGSDSATDNTMILDIDGDGFSDGIDNCPNLPNADQLDTDNDALGNACDYDDDGDGLSDSEEIHTHLTDPLDSDTDDDGMDDKYEIVNSLNPSLHDADLDKDGDGLTNLQEYQNGSNPSDHNDPPTSSRSSKVIQIILPLILN